MTILVTVSATGHKAYVTEGKNTDEELAPTVTVIEEGNEQVFAVYGEKVLVVSEKDLLS
jgi:hypothetical protein